MAEVKAYVVELEEINNELKRIRDKAKVLREFKNSVEKKIMEYLEERGEIGLIYKGKNIIFRKKTKRTYKKKKDKENDAIAILQTLGIRDPKKVLEEVINSQKGQEVEVGGLIVKPVPKNKF